MFPPQMAIVDVETTGLSSVRDRIIDLAIIRVEDGSITETLNTLINPEVYIPKEIEIMTGIHAPDLEKAPRFFDVYERVQNLLKDAVFVAHNVRFDYSFIRAELSRYGTNYTAKQLDTVRLFSKIYPKKRHNLDVLIDTFHIPVESRHRAYPDAKVLWDFIQVVPGHTTQEFLATAINHAMHRPSLPSHVPSDLIDALPEKPGVYHFFGEKGVSLYIGKSINIKNRVLSHFTDSLTNSRERKLSEEARHIEAIPTTGELSALLLESTMIKAHQPLHNRLLRHAYKLIAAKEIKADHAYARVTLETFYDMDASHVPNTIGMFRSIKQAKSFLEETAKEFNLCPKLLGLESGKGGCFWKGLGWCNGACVGEESVPKYNLRFVEAFAKKRFKAWPFAGPILIREETHDHAQAIVVDKWCVLGSCRWDSDLSTDFLNSNLYTLNSSYSFDLDTYKILQRFIFSPTYQKNIRLLKKSHEPKSVYI